MHYKQYKSILSPKNGMNIYRGCTHGCIYCDSRSTCYQMDHDFEDIEIKSNAPEMLEEALKKKRSKCMIGTGAMSDPYLPLEKELAYTRKCLEIIDRYGFGVTILTKSDLILRDIDILKSINKKSKCVVQMTMTTYDEELCAKLEPHVCSTKRRAQVLNVMKENGIPTIVWLCPILPFINDTEENLLGILDYCLKASVKGILNFGFGVTLREGNREYFYSELDRLFPLMKQKYIQSFGNDYQCTSPNNLNLMKLYYEFCNSNSILYNTNKIFSYLNDFPERQTQLSLF